MQSYEHIDVAPNPTGFGATVTGCRLAAPLGDAVRREILAAWGAHAVLSFPDQALDMAGVERVTQQLGAFGIDSYVKPADGSGHVIEVRRTAHESAPVFGSQWHSDWSFQARPPGGTLLYGVEVPPVGGDTLFADGARAYEALAPGMRKRLEGLTGVHSAKRAYGPTGLFARDDATRSMRIVVSKDAERTERHPVVRTHPVSGRKSLFVNHVYTLGIDGMSGTEGRSLLADLLRHMTDDAFVYRHRWRRHMLVLWDNRSVVHAAKGGYQGHARLMWRTILAGERPR